ncbi:GlsB/YeaQ/YmgE family stress response membrane protein [Fischerella thermalis]
MTITGVGFNFGGLIVAIIGAIIAIFIWSLITRRSAA